MGLNSPLPASLRSKSPHTRILDILANMCHLQANASKLTIFPHLRVSVLTSDQGKLEGF